MDSTPDKKSPDNPYPAFSKKDPRTAIWVIVCLFAIATFFGVRAINSTTEELSAKSSAPTPVTPPSRSTSIQEVILTESQCAQLKNEFYSLITQEPYTKTQLAKELLEQYAADAGIPVNKDNPNIRYNLPNSQCGHYLDTTLNTIIAGEKNAQN